MGHSSPLPVAVKYSSSPDYQPQVRQFMDDHDSPLGFVITKDTLREREPYMEVPLWLLIC